jgi:hypothetical protein
MGDLRCQELRIVLASDLTLEVLGCNVEFVALGCLVAQCLGLLVQELECVVLCDVLALGCLDVVPCPLPQLTPRHLGSSSVLHEEVDGHAANAPYPSLHVAQTNVKVLANAVFGDLSWHVHVQQIVGSDVHIFPAHMHLVGFRHVFVEDLGCNGSKRGVSNPGAVVTSAHLAELVGANLCHGGVVRLLVVLDGDLGGHTTHCMHTSLVTGLDEQFDVCVHEGARHGDGVSVGEDEVRVLAETLDGAEDVVPATAVEARGVVAEFVDDLLLLVRVNDLCLQMSYLVHLKGGSDGLDQDSASDGAPLHANVVLGQVEDVVPQACLKMRFHLGQVEVWAGAALDELVGVVEEVQTEVEEAARDGLAVDSEVLLLKMPASGARNESG